MRSHRKLTWACLGMCLWVVACALHSPGSGELHRWWAGLGPVLPHDSFPADCETCHVGEQWHELKQEFEFDHERETGVALEGAHAQAQCLRCHNDRGPVQVFASKGCAGCHQDVHYGDLGKDCTSCHDQHTWWPQGQIERHARTRFPLTGAHAGTACHRCHPGAGVGNFVPTDPTCVTCHTDDLARAINPPHALLGFVNDCQRCHPTTSWKDGRVN